MRTADTVYAYNNMQEAVDNLNYIWENVDKEADVIYQQALRMADKLCIEPVIPRTVMRQAHRNNVPAETPLIYYKQALIIPLLGAIISEITVRFEKTHCIGGKVLCLVPSIICNEDSTTFHELDKMYESDLPNPDAVDQELMLWKRKYTLREAIDTQNLFLLNSKTIGCQSKPKRGNFISKIFFLCGL